DEGLEEELADVLYEVNRAGDAKVLHEWLERRFGQHEGFDYQITRPDGKRFFYSFRLASKSLPLPDPFRDFASPAYDTESLEDSSEWRVVRVRVPGPDGLLTVQVARSLDAFKEERATLLLPFLVTGPLALLIGTAGGYFLARRALGPVQKMTET